MIARPPPRRASGYSPARSRRPGGWHRERCSGTSRHSERDGPSGRERRTGPSGQERRRWQTDGRWQQRSATASTARSGGSPTAALSARYPIYTRANVGEVFPDPVTPLTFDSGLWLAELGWRDAWVRMGAFEPDEFADDEYVQLGVVGGYCYLNASLIRLFGERAPGLSWQVMDEQFFGAQPGIPPYEEQAGDVRPDLTERIGATFAWALSVERLSDLAELTEDMRVDQAVAGRAPGPRRRSPTGSWSPATSS